MLGRTMEMRQCALVDGYARGACGRVLICPEVIGMIECVFRTVV